jgi:hypothetical protein
MAPPADQGTGDREDNPWMQPANGLWNPEDNVNFNDAFIYPYMMQPENGLWNPEDDVNFNDIFTYSSMMQPENGLWNPEDNVNFNDIFTYPSMMQPENGLWNSEDDANFNGICGNMLMMQPAVGRDRTTRASSNHINGVVANESDYGGYTNANIPRGEGAMEQIQALVTPPFQMADSNIEPQHLPGNTIFTEEGQDEPGYITHTRTPHATKRVRKNSGPSSEEWLKRKPQIYSLYVDGNYKLEATRAEMAERGFHAELVTLLLFSLRILC